MVTQELQPAKAATVHVLAHSEVELIAGALRSLAYSRRGTIIEDRARSLADIIERSTQAVPPTTEDAGRLLVQILRLTLALTCSHCQRSSLAIDNDKIQSIKQTISDALQLAYKHGREAR